VSADALRLVQAHHRTVAALARDRELAADDEAFRALVRDGQELLANLEDVVADADFWSRLTSAAAGSAVLTDEQRESLEHLSGSELTAVFETLRYAPPPPLETFIEDTLDALDLILESNLPGEVRAARVQNLKFELTTFVMRLRRLLNARTVVVAAGRERRRVRRALRWGSKLVPPLAAAVVGIAGESFLVNLGVDVTTSKIVGKVGEGIAAAGAQRLQVLLDEDPQAGPSVVLEEINPIVRVRAFARVLEGRIARAAELDDLDLLLDTLDYVEAELGRLGRAVQLAGQRSDQLNHALQEIGQYLENARKATTGVMIPGIELLAVRIDLWHALGACKVVLAITESTELVAVVGTAANAASIAKRWDGLVEVAGLQPQTEQQQADEDPETVTADEGFEQKRYMQA
jgi:hypothetical protein